jgi:hypothetical protein
MLSFEYLTRTFGRLRGLFRPLHLHKDDKNMPVQLTDDEHYVVFSDGQPYRFCLIEFIKPNWGRAGLFAGYELRAAMGLRRLKASRAFKRFSSVCGSLGHLLQQICEKISGTDSRNFS